MKFGLPKTFNLWCIVSNLEFIQIPNADLSGMFPSGSTLSRNYAEYPAKRSLSSLVGGEALRPSESGDEPSLLKAESYYVKH